MQASKPALEDYLVLILLSAIWGASFLFLRVSSPVFRTLLSYRNARGIWSFGLVAALYSDEEAS